MSLLSFCSHNLSCPFTISQFFNEPKVYSQKRCYYYNLVLFNLKEWRQWPTIVFEVILINCMLFACIQLNLINVEANILIFHISLCKLIEKQWTLLMGHLFFFVFGVGKIPTNINSNYFLTKSKLNVVIGLGQNF